MYGKLCSFVSWVRSKLALGLVCTVAVLVAASAQAAETLTIDPPAIPWTSIPQQITSALSTPIIVGLGIGLSIWVIFVGIRFFRRSAKG